MFKFTTEIEEARALSFITPGWESPMLLASLGRQVATSNPVAGSNTSDYLRLPKASTAVVRGNITKGV